MKSKRLIVFASAIFALLVIFTGINRSADNPKKKTSEQNTTATIAWKSFENGVELATKQKKLLVIDFYTNWCHWCKVMDKETYANEQIVAFDGQQAFFSKVNAESKDRFAFRGATYSGPELAMMFGVQGYPTTAFMSGEGELLTTISGYLPPDRFKMILRYFSEDHYKTTEWKAFLEQESKS